MSGNDYALQLLGSKRAASPASLQARVMLWLRCQACSQDVHGLIMAALEAVKCKLDHVIDHLAACSCREPSQTCQRLAGSHHGPTGIHDNQVKQIAQARSAKQERD
jgi:hypothetical protein